MGSQVTQGEKNLGAPNGLVGGGVATLSLRGMDPGAIKHFIVELMFTLISTGAAFNNEILQGASAAAVGVDDLDALLLSLTPSWYLQVEGETFQYGPIDPRFLRRVLAYFNNADMNVYPGNGTSIPASNGTAAAYKVTAIIPEDLTDLMMDGDIFHQGSVRMETGQFGWTLGASLTPSVVLANGTATVGAFAMNVRVRYGSGSAGDVGPLWQVFTNNVNNVWRFDDGQPRLALFDQLKPISNPGSGITINETSNTDVQSLSANYAQDRQQAGQYAVNAAFTPYLWVKPSENFNEWMIKAERVTRIEITAGVTNINIVDVRVKGVSPEVMGSVAMKVAGSANSPVSSIPILPKSLPQGSSIPAQHVAYAGTRIVAGSMPKVNGKSVGVSHPNPSALVAFHSGLSALASQQKATKIGLSGRQA